jgi:hypothetical protein
MLKNSNDILIKKEQNYFCVFLVSKDKLLVDELVDLVSNVVVSSLTALMVSSSGVNVMYESRNIFAKKVDFNFKKLLYLMQKLIITYVYNKIDTFCGKICQNRRN